ncbi:MAG: carbamoyl phosphate synthase small subunit, partial [Lachnospiraceae bacterium]|nr:carbamoyl phosphate synthase small subunit [Lachnospiraceae bacterium]
TRWVRDHGSCRVLITDDPELPAKDAAEQMRRLSLPKDAVSRVSCREARLFQPGTIQETAGADPESTNSAGADPAGSIPASADPAGETILRGLGQGEVIDDLHAAAGKAKRPLVAAIDCGMKRNIVRSFLARGVSVAVFPWNVTAEEIRALRPDGVFLSNGPGDPQDVPETVQTVREIMGDVPLFGICLGHQIIALAAGARTYKLKFGHRGGNHPVRELATGRIEITSQNHSYAVDRASLAGTGLEVTHVNLLDDTVEGLACPDRQVFSVQYHPESAPGPQDSGYLFDRFVHMIAGS